METLVSTFAIPLQISFLEGDNHASYLIFAILSTFYLISCKLRKPAHIMHRCQ